ncbi:MAG: SusC/RagA family TonB-linked outer membrane protein, partial [Saprospiraceae bacterium]|nr:SusC/RagA family TonB-linked outer membrane protein [Saprospiraceae bacterium]
GSTTSPEAVVAAGIVPHTSFLQAKVLTNNVVQSAGYFSLRNINIGYTFSKSQLNRLNMEGLRIYATGQNLIYKTSDDYDGFNPEYIDRNDSPRAYGSQRAGTPMFRTVTFGLNIDF